MERMYGFLKYAVRQGAGIEYRPHSGRTLHFGALLEKPLITRMIKLEFFHSDPAVLEEFRERLEGLVPKFETADPGFNVHASPRRKLVYHIRQPTRGLHSVEVVMLYQSGRDSAQIEKIRDYVARLGSKPR